MFGKSNMEQMPTIDRESLNPRLRVELVYLRPDRAPLLNADVLLRRYLTVQVDTDVRLCIAGLDVSAGHLADFAAEFLHHLLFLLLRLAPPSLRSVNSVRQLSPFFFLRADPMLIVKGVVTSTATC